jgi:hypothetical protein
MKNKSYIYCTISVGLEYYNKAVEFAKKLNEIGNKHKVLIVTDIDYEDISNVIFIKLNNRETKFIKNFFNYNLKYIPILECSKLNFDFVFYFDSDWEINEEYKEEKIENFLNEFNESPYDFIYERPHNIGESKKDLERCFWRHKIQPYGLMDTDFYDSGQVVNEQFLAFKNNEKLSIFCEKWKERNEFGVTNEIWAFAEGLEIGMSCIDANIKMTWHNLNLLSNCFKFNSKQNITYTRF